MSMPVLLVQAVRAVIVNDVGLWTGELLSMATRVLDVVLHVPAVRCSIAAACVGASAYLLSGAHSVTRWLPGQISVAFS